MFWASDCLAFGFWFFYSYDRCKVMRHCHFKTNLSALFYLLSDRSLCALLPVIEERQWWFVSFENLGWSTQFFQMPLWFSQTECTLVSQSWKLIMMFLCGYKSSFKQSWPMAMSHFTAFFVQPPPLREETKKRRVPLLLSHSTDFSWFKHTHTDTHMLKG